MGYGLPQKASGSGGYYDWADHRKKSQFFQRTTSHSGASTGYWLVGNQPGIRKDIQKLVALGRRKMHPKASNFLALPKPDHAAVLDLS